MIATASNRTEHHGIGKSKRREEESAGLFRGAFSDMMLSFAEGGQTGRSARRPITYGRPVPLITWNRAPSLCPMAGRPLSTVPEFDAPLADVPD